MHNWATLFNFSCVSKISASREQSQACLNYAEAPPNLSNLGIFIMLDAQLGCACFFLREQALFFLKKHYKNL